MSRQAESSIVTKCGQILDVVTRARRPLAFSDIVERTGFVKSSCHRILAVLQGENLVSYDKPSRTYRAGPRLLRWARGTWHSSDIQQVASEPMSDLSDGAHMNAALSVLDANAVLYLRTVDFFNVRFASHPGDRAPLHSTAAGKVFLAHMRPARQQATLGALNLEKFTEHTIISLEPLVAQFAEIRGRHFAVARGEEVLQVTGIASPIWDTQDQHVACLSLWSVRDHHAPDDVIAMADSLVECARAISQRLGWVNPA